MLPFNNGILFIKCCYHNEAYLYYRYFVRCWTPLDDTAPQLNATVSSATTHRFLESDGVVDNTIYLCAVHFIFGLNNYTAASDPVSFKSLLDTSKFVCWHYDTL